MKRFLLVLLSLLLCFSLSGCMGGIFSLGGGMSFPQGGNVALLPEVSEPEQSESSVPSSAPSSAVSEERIRELVEENLYCMSEVFMLSSLPRADEPLYDMVYPVDEGIFASYEAFETYLRGVYAKEYAELLLYDMPFEGDPKYIDVDGKLCVNALYDTGSGYYVIWDGYTFEIVSEDEETCTVVLHAQIEEPADVMSVEPYDVEITLVNQDGVWLLSEMFS